MLRRFVDDVLAVMKESVKTFTYESLNNIARLINGFSGLVLTILPGKATILEGLNGWELRPTLRGPRFPRWMEDGVSSFNKFIHELSVDAETSSTVDSISGGEDNEETIFPASPMSQASCLSHMSSLARNDLCLLYTIKWFFSSILWPATFLLDVPFVLFESASFRIGETFPNDKPKGHQSSGPHLTKKLVQPKDPLVQHATDRRRGVVEDLQLAIEIFIESVFDIFHKAAHFILSPSEVCQRLFRWFSSHGSSGRDDYDGDAIVAVQTATFCDVDPTPTERRTAFHQSLNMDARTCQDVISELGFQDTPNHKLFE